jgi:zinc protease
MIKIFFFLIVVSFNVMANDSFLDSVKRMKWGNLDVVWVEDTKFPKFTASVYFKDGALSDSLPGVSQATFDQLSSGTGTQSQRELSEFFDFYGVNFRQSITHEYSVYSVQALTKDIEPVMGKVCELFRDAQYPKSELQSYLSRSKSRLKNLGTSHGALADRVFRHISLANTAYAQPTEGTLQSLDKITSEVLKERLNTFNKTKKVLYLAGPKEVKEMAQVIAQKCPWTSESEVKEVKLKKSERETYIYLVPVPGANQAQIRIGRYLTEEEFKGKYDKYQFLAGFLGGGFTSKLVQELRVKRGLTYSAGAYVSLQRDYGRAGIMTFSKNETTAEAITLIRQIFNEVGEGRVSDSEFKHQQGHQIGAYSFGFEETTAFLAKIMLYDHQRRDLEELAKFPDIIAGLKPRELSQSNMETFDWQRQTIVIVGDKSLAKSLMKIRPVKILDYKDFL